jgi:hypothetical protein
MKTMSPVCNETEWTTYIGVVMKSEICEIELVARMIGHNDVGDESSRSSTLSEAVDEQDVECGIMLTQPSQETQDHMDVDEPPFVASNETMLNVEPVSASVGVGDAGANVELILGMDHQSTAIGFVLDVDLPSIESEFMPEYEAAFGYERAEDSTDDRPVPELSNRDKVLLHRELVEHAPEMLDCRDFSQAHRTVANCLRFDDSAPLINYDNIIIRKGIIFKIMEAMKIWLAEYAMFHHHPFMVKHSNEDKHYVITYHRGCPWTVHARKGKDDSWRITSVVQPHTCVTNVDDRKHAQFSSRSISQRLVNIIKNCPLMTVMTLIEVVMVAWGYLGMHFEYTPKPDVMGPEGRHYFFRAF